MERSDLNPDDDYPSWIAPGRRIADLEWFAFFALVTVAVAVGTVIGVAVFYYVVFKNIGS